MIFAYADPPYVGCAHRYEEGKEVNLPLLIDHLVTGYPDGWAMSCHSPSLRQILPLCPEDVRVMAWVKPWAVFRPNVNPAYAWEPVIVRGGRKRTREQVTVRDWVSCNITMKKGLVGTKPRGFCDWLVQVFNVQAGDEIIEIFRGLPTLQESVQALQLPL